MELEKDTWYWVSHPQEDDIFYPVWVHSDGSIIMDGKHNPPEVVKGLNYSKAVMPTA